MLPEPSTNLSGGNGGVVLTLASGNTASANVTGDEIAAAIYDIAQTFDERDIPPTDRFCVLPPTNIINWLSLLQEL